MTSRLKIDLTQGILEVEGTEPFVRAIYQDFKLQFLGDDLVEVSEKPPHRRRSRKTKTAPEPPPAVAPAPDTPQVVTAESEEPPRPAPPEYNLIKELDLAAARDRPSLVEFMDSKFPITNEERNLVFVYYLQQLAGEKPVTRDHVFTCYRKAKIRAPLNLDHSLDLTADPKNWIKIAKNGNISITAPGKEYLERQLPKKMKS
jgi:hypothetical protein